MPQVYLFSEFRLDCKNWALYRGGSVVDLPPKMIDTLIHLVSHAGEVISHEELMDRVWPGMVVVHGALKRNISTIRFALGDEPPHKIIQTVKNRGYVFTLPVTAQNNDDSDTAPISYTDNSYRPESATPPLAINNIKRSPAPRLHPILIVSLAIIAAAIVSFILAVQSRQHRAIFVAKQITSNSQQSPIIGAAISPNGNMIAFYDGSNLYVSDAQTHERHQLALPNGVIPNSFDWFPDSVHLLISSVNAKTSESFVWNMSVLGGKPVLLLQNVQNAVASPDGHHIAFERNNNTELWIADPTGQNERLIYSNPNTGEVAAVTHFSTDSQYLLLLHLELATQHSYITAHNLTTNRFHTLLKSEKTINNFILMAHGGLLLSSYIDNMSMSMQLLMTTINIESASHAEPSLMESFPDETIDCLSATTNGDKIMILRGRVQSDAYIASLSNSGTTITGPRRLTISEREDRPAGWLDNNTILIASNRLGTFSIFSQAINSNEVISLAIGNHNYYRPVISADHQWLLYVVKVGSEPQAHFELHRKSLRDNNELSLYSSDDDTLLLQCASYSNLCVLAEHQQDECVFFEFDPAGGRGRELARLRWRVGLSSHNWDLSRDGKRIALIDAIDGESIVEIIDLQHPSTKHTSMKLTVPSPARTLSWDADSNGFYVSSYTDENAQFNLLHIGLDGTTTVLRSELSSQDGFAIPSPDGKYLAYQKYSLTSNIWVLQRK